MRLSYTREFRLALGYIMIVSVFLISAFLFLDGLLAYISLLIVIGIFCCAPSVMLILQERWLHATLPNGNSVLIRDPYQPEPRRALATGEKLVINYQPDTSGLLGSNVFLGMIAFLFLEGFFLYFSPHLRLHLLAFITSTPHQLTLTPLQWAILIYPVLFSITYIVGFRIYRVDSRHQVISVDDQGISIQSPWRPLFSMGWHEIRLFASIDDRYFLFGLEHALFFTLLNIDDDTHLNPVQMHHKVDADCLLATITTRAGTPLHSGVGYLRPVNVASFYSGEEMAAFPPAAALWQSADMAAMFSSQDLPPKLKMNIAPRMLFAFALRWSLLVSMGYFFFSVLANATSKVDLLYVITSMLILWLLFIPLIALMRLQFLRDRYPSVLAKEDKLVSRGYNDKEVASIRWEDIAAWGVAQPVEGVMNGAAYAAVSHDGTMCVSWFENVNFLGGTDSFAADSHDNYYATATKLHAYIAQRTELPLRDVPNGHD